MRAVFSLLGLVIVAAVVLQLAKRQSQTVVALPAVPGASAASVPLTALPQAVDQQLKEQAARLVERASEASGQ